MKAQRKKQIKRLALELLQQIEQHGLLKFPLPMKAIAEEVLDIEIRMDPFNDVEKMAGMIFKSSHGTVIGINEKNHPNRQRFTIAHEIGHYMLHGQETLIIDKNLPAFVRFRDDEISAGGYDPDEIEANAYAAELLMPEFEVKPRFDKICFDLGFDIDYGVAELAKHFGVSNQAMTFRLINLNLVNSY